MVMEVTQSECNKLWCRKLRQADMPPMQAFNIVPRSLGVDAHGDATNSAPRGVASNILTTDFNPWKKMVQKTESRRLDPYNSWCSLRSCSSISEGKGIWQRELFEIWSDSKAIGKDNCLRFECPMSNARFRMSKVLRLADDGEYAIKRKGSPDRLPYRIISNPACMVPSESIYKLSELNARRNPLKPGVWLHCVWMKWTYHETIHL